MKKTVLAGALSAAIGMAGTAAVAEAAFGFGLTYVFGGGIAVGVRVFSNDEPEEGALALGFDYNFQTNGFRPTVGAAYLDDDFYIDLSVGYDFGTSAMDFGIGLGGTTNMQSGKDDDGFVGPGDNDVQFN